MDNKYNIGVFDSGIGGLTVLKELKHFLPHENFIYFGDTARVPYGTKSESTIQNFATEITDFLVSHRIKMLVVACNTVSSSALDHLKHEYPNMLIIGVVLPGAKKAVETSKKKCIGIIGTVATIRSRSYEKAILALDPTIKIFQKPCSLFVPLVECGWTENKVAELTAEEYLTPLLSKNIDTLVLGCTHYPLLKKVIKKVMKKATLVDSATEVARMTLSYLTEKRMLNLSLKQGKIEYWLSDISSYFMEATELILGEKNIRINLKKM